MKKVRKVSIVSLVLASVVLSGCGSKDDEKAGAPTPTPTSETTPSEPATPSEPTETETPDVTPPPPASYEPEALPSNYQKVKTAYYSFGVPKTWTDQGDSGVIKAFYVDLATGDSLNVIEFDDVPVAFNSKDTFTQAAKSELKTAGFKTVSNIEEVTLAGETGFSLVATGTSNGVSGAVYQVAVTHEGRYYLLTVGSKSSDKAAANYNSIAKTWDWS